MSSPHKYFLRQYSNENYWHGGIGYTHIETILEKEGYKPVELPVSSVRFISFFHRLVKLVSIFFFTKRTDEWVFIFPVYGRMNRWLVKILLAKKTRLIAIVGDIDGLQDGDDVLLKKEIAFLHRLPILIVHNIAMEEWIRSTGYTGKTVMLQLFDFLTMPVQTKRSLSKSVVFAGNLSKSNFLFQLDQPVLRNVNFNVYGKGFDHVKQWPQNLTYKGAFAPLEMPAIVEGSFGLLWNGDQWDQPGGSFGRYIKYISPHKLSLYILAGLPILIPRFAGASRFIEENCLGIVIDSPADIETAISKISEEDYRIICNNLAFWAEWISKGEQLRRAVREAREK